MADDDNVLDTPAEAIERGCFGSLLSLIVVVILIGVALLIITKMINV